MVTVTSAGGVDEHPAGVDFAMNEDGSLSVLDADRGDEAARELAVYAPGQWSRAVRDVQGTSTTSPVAGG